MKKNFTRMIAGTTLALTICCGAALPAFAVEARPISGYVDIVPISAEVTKQLPDSVLYYGTVKTIMKNTDGSMKSLKLESEKYGEYIMHLSDETVWIDSGKKGVSDAATLSEGERIYVFHSTVATASLPSQSTALAIVRNLPQDAGCAQYYVVDQVETVNGKTQITVAGGETTFVVNEKTTYAPYLTRNIVKLNDIQKDSRIMVWSAKSCGVETASHIMLLPDAVKALTRSALVEQLYEAAGSPAVTGEIRYTDVAKDSDAYDAILWATQNGFVNGYGSDLFGMNDTISREQLVTILWRYAGSPVLMDYSGLSGYADAKDISSYARQAMAWAHQKGLVDRTAETLQPAASVTTQEAANLISALVDAK